jgi:hypothetical protein
MIFIKLHRFRPVISVAALSESDAKLNTTLSIETQIDTHTLDTLRPFRRFTVAAVAAISRRFARRRSGCQVQ